MDEVAKLLFEAVARVDKLRSERLPLFECHADLWHGQGSASCDRAY